MINNSYTSIKIFHSSFLSCVSYSNYGGAIYLNVKESVTKYCIGNGCYSEYMGLFIYSIANSTKDNQLMCSSILKCAPLIKSTQIVTTALDNGIIIADSSNISNNYASRVPGIIGYKSESKVFRFLNIVHNYCESKVIQTNGGKDNLIEYSNFCFNNVSIDYHIAIHPTSHGFKWMFNKCIVSGNSPSKITFQSHAEEYSSLILFTQSFIEAYSPISFVSTSSNIASSTIINLGNVFSKNCPTFYTLKQNTKIRYDFLVFLCLTEH